jgi:hypothetical protein
MSWVGVCFFISSAKYSPAGPPPRMPIFMSQGAPVTPRYTFAWRVGSRPLVLVDPRQKVRHLLCEKLTSPDGVDYSSRHGGRSPGGPPRVHGFAGTTDVRGAGAWRSRSTIARRLRRIRDLDRVLFATLLLSLVHDSYSSSFRPSRIRHGRQSPIGKGTPTAARWSLLLALLLGFTLGSGGISVPAVLFDTLNGSIRRFKQTGKPSLPTRNSSRYLAIPSGSNRQAWTMLSPDVSILGHYLASIDEVAFLADGPRFPVILHTSTLRAS